MLLCFVFGCKTGDYTLQDLGMAGLLINQSSLIDFYLVFRPLSGAGASAGILVGIYSMVGEASSIFFNLVGGQVFANDPIQPFFVLWLPTLCIVATICIVNLFCRKTGL